MKYEWRKAEKQLYLPERVPTLIDVPKLKYFMVEGTGNPNGTEFGKAVGSLYAMAYGVRMAPKKGINPEGYYEYTVYPLEGLWSLNEAGIAQIKSEAHFDKKNLVFKLMIRQPDFVTSEFAEATIERVSKTKPNSYNQKIRFEELGEGLCLQLLHLGSYDTEPESFQKMADYCQKNQLIRKSPDHKEIYLSDPRKSAPEKNKTVLRFSVKKNVNDLA